ncbi:MAG: hypothetical protein RL220_1127, partial [Bacteroidota bacterium]
PYMLYRAHWKSFASTLVFILLLNALPGIFIGMQHQTSLLQSRWNLINPAQDRHLFDVEETSFHSLTTVIPILCMEDSGDRSTVPFARNLCDLEPQEVKWIIHLARFLLVLGAMWFLRTVPFRSANSQEHAWWEFSYLLLCIPLIFPHQQHYAFLMGWPAMLWQLRTWLNRGSGSLFTKLNPLLFLLVFICFNGSILLGFWRAELEHFKIVTFGALILIVLHIRTPPVLAGRTSVESPVK